MNWFEKLILNANTHNLGAAGLLLTGIFAPEVIPLAKAAMGAVGLAISGAALPGGSILEPAPSAVPLVTLPPAAAGGSYHAVDYAALAAALLQQFAPPPK